MDQQPNPEASPLALDARTMRNLGYAVVDLLVDRAASAADAPVVVTASRAEMERRLREPPPPAGEPFDQLLSRLAEDVLPFALRSDHPRHFGYIPSGGTWPSVLGDFIAAACNVNAIFWAVSAGVAELELVVLDWFKEWLGYPPQAAGVLVSGGSAANITALACARETRLGGMSDRLTIYVSDQAHSSVARAARLLGFQPDQVRVLPADDDFRLPPDVLAQAMTADTRAGREPLAVVAAAGTTNTGAVDPLPELAALAAEHGAWLHVDGAYGGVSVLTERGRAALAGIERADSVTVDPHKWLYQPYECGCVLLRDGAKLRSAFQISPPYLKDVASGEVEVDFADQGLQLSRTARAVKLWLSLKTFGVDAFRRAMDRASGALLRSGPAVGRVTLSASAAKHQRLPMKRKLPTAVALLGLLVVLPLSRVGAGPASRTTEPVALKSDASVVVGSSTLTRTHDGVSFSLQTTRLSPGHAVTVWWMVVNPDGGMAVLYAAGHVIDDSGTAEFGGSLKVGDGDGLVMGDDTGMEDALGATVYLVVRDHGEADSGTVDDQVHTFAACNSVCQDLQVSVHSPS